MKCVHKVSPKTHFEIEGSTQKEIFEQLALVDEVFAGEPCGLCEDVNTKFIVREVDGNKYYERKCGNCGGKLAYGQNKTGGTLFPKRKVENDVGEEVYDKEAHGWHRWVPNADEAKPKSKKK